MLALIILRRARGATIGDGQNVAGPALNVELLAEASTVDLHAGLTLLLQLGNDPPSTEHPIASITAHIRRATVAGFARCIAGLALKCFETVDIVNPVSKFCLAYQTEPQCNWLN